MTEKDGTNDVDGADGSLAAGEAAGRGEPAGTGGVAGTDPPGATDVIDEDDPGALIARLRRNAIGSLVVLAAGTALVTLDPGPVLGVVLSGALMIVNFEVLERVVGRVLEKAPEGPPGAAQMLFLAFRLVLLALLLCGIFLVPGISPISVALGLSVLVLAVLIEASTQLFSG